MSVRNYAEFLKKISDPRSPDCTGAIEILHVPDGTDFDPNCPAGILRETLLKSSTAIHRNGADPQGNIIPAQQIWREHLKINICRNEKGEIHDAPDGTPAVMIFDTNTGNALECTRFQNNDPANASDGTPGHLKFNINTGEVTQGVTFEECGPRELTDEEIASLNESISIPGTPEIYREGLSDTFTGLAAAATDYAKKARSDPKPAYTTTYLYRKNPHMEP